MKRGEKIYLDRNVLDATKERLRLVFAHFERVCVAFSGGKDSTVLLHLAIELAREMGRLPVHAMLLDLEGQYAATMEHVRTMFDMPEVRGWWICLPINLRNASSAAHPYWCAWEPGREADWVRPMPEHPCVVKDQAFFPFYKYRMEFEEFVPAFNEWFAGDGSAAFLVGIRADESLHRYKAVKKQAAIKKCAWTPPGGEPVQWSAKNTAKSKAVSFFPIYDWGFEDLWRYIHDNRLDYNRLYDWMYLTGMPFSEMRICQPYGDDQRKGLDLFHKIEPQTWFRIVQRVEGANYAALYARQKLLGYKGGLGLPPAFSSYRQYVDFLMRTLPDGLRAVYGRRIKVFTDWWAENGYPLEDWPDAGEPALENKKAQPSWRRVAVSILKQDMAKGLSFGFARKDTDRLIEIKERWKSL
jgi:predicted phosphoadenosine phosphosulfate sulfurtransferase